MAIIIMKHGCGRHGADHPKNKTRRGKKKIKPSILAVKRS